MHVKALFRTVLAAWVAAVSLGAAAGPIQLLKDINPYVLTKYTSGPPAPLGSGWVLPLCSDNYGCEPWFTDGTSANTRRIKLSNTYLNGQPRYQAAMAGAVLYLTEPTYLGGPGARSLWRTDGTDAGTIRLTPTPFTALSGPPVVANSTFYFGANGDEVWKSDGTEAGTTMYLKLGDGSNVGIELAASGTQLYFLANDGAGNRVLWKSDGSPGNKVAVETFTGDARNLSAVAGKLFFDVGSNELWASDGTQSGTHLLRTTLRPSLAKTVVELQGVAYYLDADAPGTPGPSTLWATDGSPAGTIAARTFASAAYAPFAVTSSALFFAASDPSTGTEIWTSDGTSAGTRLVKDVATGPASGGFSRPVVAGDVVFFQAQNNFVWRSDGTEAGTYQVSTVGDARPRFAVGSHLIFDVPRALVGVVLEDQAVAFISDGTVAGTGPLIPAAASPNDRGHCSYGRNTVLDGSVIFAANDYLRGCELWKSDGTAQGTTLVKDIYPGRYGTFPDYARGDFVKAGPYAYFFAVDGVHGTQLWRTDGSDAGTVRVSNAPGSAGLGAGRDITAAGTDVFFVVNGEQLMKSNGTAAGTGPYGKQGGGALSNPTLLKAFGDVLYFVASDTTGTALWKAAPGSGAVLVKRFDEFSGIRDLQSIGNMLLFVATDAASGEEMWRSDGTPSGTVRVQDINPGAYSGVGKVLGTLGNAVLFAGLGRDPGLWRTDGTADGTFKVADALPTSAIPYMPSPTAVIGRHMYFEADNQSLYRTDGTAGGTSLVANFWPIAGLDSMIAAEGTLFFLAPDPGNGMQWWQSNGTPQGTFVIDRLGLPNGLTSSNPPFMAMGTANGIVFYTWDKWVDLELFVIPFDRTPDPVSFAPLVDVSSNTYAISAPAAVQGTNVSVPAVATGGQVCVSSANDCSCDLAAFAPSNPVNYGQYLCVRQRTATAPLTTTTTSLSIGGVPATFSTTTAASSPPPGSAISLDRGFHEVAEDGGAVVIQVIRAGVASSTVSVDFATSDATALAGVHYVPQSGTLTWPPGDVAPKLVSIPVIDDSVANGTRTFQFSLSSPVAAITTAPAASTVSIFDDDATVQFTVSQATVVEGPSALTLTVNRVGAIGIPASVDWIVGGGTAVAGIDYSLPSGGTLEWDANDTSPRTITVRILDDRIPEPTKTFAVTLASPVNLKLGAVSNVDVTLLDNDSGMIFAAQSYAISEGGESITLQVQRLGPATLAASVKWTAVNGTAMVGKDFGNLNVKTLPSGTVSWRAGESGLKSLTIPILPNFITEGNRNFSVVLSAPVGGAVGSPGTAFVNILDDDGSPDSLVFFTQPKFLVTEGTANAAVVVRRQSLSGSINPPLYVSYVLVPGSAMPNSDYEVVGGTFSWLPGETADRTLLLPIVDNAIAENHESFRVVLSPAGPKVRIDNPEALVVIVDDDEAFPKYGVVPDGWTVPAAATKGWHASNDAGAYEGVFSLRSDAIGDGESSQIEVTRDFAAGNITFRAKVSSEAGYDVLRFFVDGVETASWSGTTVTGWQMFTIPVAAGNHTLRWSYEKDSSASVGYDAAWIDGVVLP